jgi:uncharacterized protein with PhoU and TrkA domain
LVGLVVIQDAIVRFSYHVLRWEESRKEWVAALVEAMQDHVITNAFYVGKRLMVVARLKIGAGSSLVGKSLGKLTQEHRLHVLSHFFRGKPGFWPGMETSLREGDELAVQTEPATLQELHQVNAGEGKVSR